MDRRTTFVASLVAFGWFAAIANAQPAGQVGPQPQIGWQTDYNAACKAAGEQRRLVLLHFYSDNCPPCERLEAQVFPNPEVVDAIGRNYVPVKLYVKQAPNLVKHYQIDRWPTDVVITPQGQEVYRTISPQSPKEYSLMLNGLAVQTGVAAGHDGIAAAAAGAARSAFPSAAEAVVQAQDRAQAAVQHAGTAVDHIAAAATMPSLLPSRRSTFGADQVATSSPQPVTINGGTNEVPRPETIGANAGAGYQAAAAAATAPYAAMAADALANSIPPGFAPVNPAAGAPGPQPPAPQPNMVASAPFAGVGAPAAAPPPAGPALPPQMQTNPFFPTQPQPQPPPPAPPAVAANYGPPAAPPPQQPLTTPPPAQPPAADASGAPPAPLENFCAVTLIENRKWKKADPKFGAIHRGRTYLFASAENQQKFLADPDRYAPILAGYDPVRFAESGKLVAGARTHGVIYRNQIFLFADEATLGAFAKTPDRFAANAYQAMSASDQTQRR